MSFTGAIKGRVRNANDVPMEDVNIVIVAGPNHPDIAAVTGWDGIFVFSGLQPGNYVIRAYSSNRISDDIPVRIVAWKTAFVDIWLETDIVDEEANVVDEI
ncbi:carboxypeptidase-like regulatory domain-containing protein [Leptolyngbya sp. FACHB-261]|uniref:carboxypeptidase-like regulatory domain-containing protein n=1 Tax=Leptolyngbya sp. FACHB-261 TaxID=2692806 RepID=UPI0016833E41|nr:carboxypeptidase-like regulatory domain-containing protein [Leptolyngbya sp. FACHB-261]MBD2104095.1 carboxypeptidase regulatory-like domain-containing protein [Leptolyngbya sp. FACHB-261]